MIVTRKGHRFDVRDSPHTKSWEYWHLFENGSWESTTFEVIDRLLPQGGRFVDVGAWIGPYTLWASLTKDASVLAFEPDPVAYEELQHNVSANNLQAQCTLVPAAAMSRVGAVDLYEVNEFGASASSTTYERGKFISVPAFRLSEFLRHEWGRFPDLIKIDIEGGEIDLMPDLLPLLDEHHIPAILATHVDRCDWTKLEPLLKRMNATPIAGDPASLLYAPWLISP